MPKIKKAPKAPFPRDENGYGAAPAFKDFAIPSEGLAPGAVINGAEVAIKPLLDDIGNKDIAAKWVEGDNDLTAWEPGRPEGEGWQWAGVFPADEGPFALFTRPAPNGNNKTGRDYAQEFLLGSLIKASAKHIKTLAKPWSELRENEQRRVMADIQADCERATRDAIDIIASNARLTFPAAVDQVVFKDGVKAVLTLAKTPEAHSLADAEGSYITIVIEERSKLLDHGDAAEGEVQKDQGSLIEAEQ